MCRLSHPPGALKETERGEVVGRFEEIGFGRAFINDTEAVELHAAAAGSVLVSQSQQIGSDVEDDTSRIT